MAHIFGNALAAREGSFMKVDQENAIQKHTRKLIAEGKLKLGDPAAKMITGATAPVFHGVDVLPEVLAAQTRYGTAAPPVEFKAVPKVDFKLNGFKYGASKNLSDAMRLGTKVSLGRGRFTCEQVSIWDVARGKELAGTPVTASPQQLRRQAIIDNAARKIANSKQVAGWRVFPELTAGRAFGWGTVLAFWGTATAVSVSCKALGITGMSDVGPVTRSYMSKPTAHLRTEYLDPMKGSLTIAGEKVGTTSNFAHGLKSRFTPNYGQVVTK